MAAAAVSGARRDTWHTLLCQGCWNLRAIILTQPSLSVVLFRDVVSLFLSLPQMEKGEAQQQPDSDKDTTMSPADLEAAESMLAHPARRQQSQYYPSSKGKGRGKGNKTRTHGVEMTAYSAVSVSEDEGPNSQRASGSEPTRQGGARTSTAAAAAGTSRVRGLAAVGGGGGGRGGPGVYEEETVGLTEESLTDSPSSAAGVSTSSDDHRAGLLGKPARPVLARGGSSSSSSRKSVASSSSLSFSNGTGGHHKSNGHAKETGVVARGEYNDEHRRVRRRALSSPSSPRQHDPLARSGSFSSEGEGEGFLSGKGGGGGGGDQHLEWKTKALWYLGAILLVGGSLVNFASFGFAPQSLLASLGSVQFISNVVFGKVILREIVTRRIIVGTATIILGNTLTLCFSPHQVCQPDCLTAVCVRVCV